MNKSTAYTRSETRPMRKHSSQQGAVAIEFAFLFMLFFVLFYAIVSYSTAMLLQQSFAHAAAEGARSALAVNPLSYTSTGDYQTSGVEPRIRNVVGQVLSWLPTKAKTHVLGGNNGNVQVTFGANNLVTVTVLYPNYNSDPLIPAINLPVFGQIPRLPPNLTGMATVSL
jgi:Flp pilus assembly protein TadG